MATSIADGQGNPGGSEVVTSQQPVWVPSRDVEKEKRTYRACLHCRQRKSRCDLYGSGTPGKPPCVECVREQHECVLGGSRRGGRRVKRAQLSADGTTSASDYRSEEGLQQSQHLFETQHVEPGFNAWNDIGSQQQPGPTILSGTSANGEPSPCSKMSVDETIASANLQNPSDALEILAHVADRAGGNNVQEHTGEIHNQHTYPTSATNMLSPHDRLLIPSMNGTVSNVIQFPPLINGLMTFDMMRDLIKRYETCYHTFFPLANQAIFDTRNLLMIAKTEPHLLAAILTVASKDDAAWWQVHEACSLHMQQLVSALVYSGSGGVEAVEALLILGEWVPRRYQSTARIGRGEEDHAAWMHVGTALRLGYLLGLDRTAFRSESDAYSSELSRKRLAWAACYISDRHVSVRIGKGFWSRGPGPMTGLRAGDFPSLQRKTPQDDDLAAILQANLELTQLFSNAHDVLYSAKSQQYQQTLGGEYVKYIDDFRVSIRTWHSVWGTLSCSPHLKSSLILSYEYLRLYVNAFAYQATMNRMVAQSNAAAGQRHPNAAFTEVAAMPDARFIYDSIDAAKSLLSIFNSFVDPVACFRFMPLRFYLYVIYSTVFLYKARATGVMGADNRGGVLRMINDTIDRLQKASACPNDLGDRYSRLIRLLWRKPPSGPGVPENNTTQPVASNTHNSSLSSDRSEHQQMIYDAFNNPTSINAFSWLDLEAVGDFATNNNSISGSLLDGLDDTIGDGFDPFDVNVGTNEYFWPGDTTQGIIF